MICIYVALGFMTTSELLNCYLLFATCYFNSEGVGNELQVKLIIATSSK